MYDERELKEINAVQSETFRIVYYFVVAIMIFKFVIFGMNGVLENITEFCIILFVPIYQNIRFSMLKIAPKTNERKISAYEIVLLVVVAATLIYGTATQKIQFSDSSAANLMLFIALFAVIRIVFKHLYNKRAEKLENRYKD